MAEIDEMAADWAKNAANNTSKMLRKYKKKIGKGLDKMQSSDNKQFWQDRVASEEAKRKRDAKVDGLNESDFIEPMEETGISTYKKKVGSNIAKKRWIEETKDYVDVAQKVSEEKGEVRTKEDAMENVAKLYDAMKAKFKEKNG